LRVCFSFPVPSCAELFRLRDTLRRMRTAYIGMGANLPSKAGPPEATLAAAASRLESLGRVFCRSSLYSTAPIGFAAQPRFINAVIALETDLTPRQLLDGLLAIEQDFGRNRMAGFENGPRTLDLDILLFDDLKISEPGLDIPHPRLHERPFVLIPLNEIAPQLSHPRSGKTVSQLLQSLFPSPESEIHAVVKVESDGWRAGPDRGIARGVVGPGQS
jgi:2-amino-4-hydroxy-6-hydroxymethyldihydropteridine diphosphokinase